MDFRKIQDTMVVDLQPQGSDWTCKLLPAVEFQTPKIVLSSDLDSKGELHVDTNFTCESGTLWWQWWKEFVATTEGKVRHIVQTKLGIIGVTGLDARFRTDQIFVAGQEVELIVQCTGVTLRRSGDSLRPTLRINVKNARETGTYAPAFI
jgi:hypothetical protein